MLRWWLAALLCALCAESHAHKPSDSYLQLRVRDMSIEGQWDVALRDLDFALELDADADGSITWGEVRTRQTEIAAYALAHLELATDQAACPIEARELLANRHTDGAYAVLRFHSRCPLQANVLVVTYRLFFAFDPQHRGLAAIEVGGATRTTIFSPETRQQRISLLPRASTALSNFTQFCREGARHIWLGFDHVLFLLTLLLPAVLRRSAGRWTPVETLKPALLEVVKVVSAFTLAHSVTLSLAALGFVTLPSRVVESAIAASVLLTALNNLYPIVHSRRWMVVFGFGLVHGLGFANVLADLALPRNALLLSLAGFNIGVELGQLAIVAAFLPFGYFARRWQGYARVAVGLSSAVIVALAAVWLVERSLDVELVSAL